jgi:glyoxylase-like metal-dependent hydrolase (beta-lactamase superfamily II)
VQFTGGVENVKALLVTHMHPDHSPLAVKLQLLSGAPLYGPAPVDDPFQDTSCDPDHRIRHNQLIDFQGLTLQAIYTPGHVDNHHCFLLQDDAVLVAGDHIMQGSTVVIIPPHGKMKEYLESLQLLKNYPINLIAPAHGEPITSVSEEIDGIISHRLAREEKVKTAIAQLHTANTADLTAVAYQDVDKSLHAIAELSLLAHLIKLEQENFVKKNNELWQLL